MDHDSYGRRVRIPYHDDPPSGRIYRAGLPRVIMSRRPVCLVIILGLLLLASGCASETYVARCTVNRDSVDGAGDAKVNDYVANMGRGALIHLDAIDESADKGMVVVDPVASTFSGNRKDARILSINGDLLELGVLDADTASYLANTNLCRS